MYATAVAGYSSININDADIREFFFENQLYRDKVYEVITKDVPHEQDQVWSRHILVADEATAQAIVNQLMNGSDWKTLAANYSTDTGSKDVGGDVGWFGTGKMVPEFETASFQLPIGAISIIHSTYGWHVIQVLGHEYRPLTETEYKTLTDTKFQEWLTKEREVITVTEMDDYLIKIPTDPTLPSTTG